MFLHEYDFKTQYSLMKESDIVFLPINHSIYNLRLSSWIYKTIAYNKFVLIKKSQTFPNESFFFKEYLCNENNLKKKLNNKTPKRKDFKKYNLDCLSQLEYFLEELKRRDGRVV